MTPREKILRDAFEKLTTVVKEVGVLRPDGMISSSLVHSISTVALKQADAVKNGPSWLRGIE